MPASESSSFRISNAVRWTICVAAAIGFLVDIYAILVGPLILQPAMLELSGLRAGTPAYRDWAGNLFWIPPLCGGFFGLIGGYLTDLFGRRRILVWTIILYTVSAFAAGYSASLPSLLFWRTMSFIGVCVEFVAAVAWLAELFPVPKTREAVLGWTQAFSSLGGIAVSGANYLANHYALSLPLIYGGHSAWRYTLLSAMLPAIPLGIVRFSCPSRRNGQGSARRAHSSVPASWNYSLPRIGGRPSLQRCCLRARTERRSARFSRLRKSRQDWRRCNAKPRRFRPKNVQGWWEKSLQACKERRNSGD